MADFAIDHSAEIDRISKKLKATIVFLRPDDPEFPLALRTSENTGSAHKLPSPRSSFLLERKTLFSEWSELHKANKDLPAEEAQARLKEWEKSNASRIVAHRSSARLFHERPFNAQTTDPP